MLLLLVSLLVSGCKIFTNQGRTAVHEEKTRDKITAVDNKLNENVADRLTVISGYSWGINYDLNKLTNKPIEVDVALQLNNRILTLSGNPSIEIMNGMKTTIDKLTSNIDSIQKEGGLLLKIKDNSIQDLQNDKKDLLQEKQDAIDAYLKLGKLNAAQADGYKSELSKMDWGMGLGAIFYGVKKLVVSMSWILGIGSILFLILRFAASSSPIAASIFGLFETMGSWVINAIRVVLPKALSIAGNVATTSYNFSKGILTKIIDNIQTLKQIQDKTGKDLTVKELLVELDKSLDQNEKTEIDQIKKTLGY